MTYSNRPQQSGFTLIELSIVIVIIGMLVGGVLMGKNLIRNADLQTIITDAAKYKSSAKQFKDKYMAIPGDFSEATSIWGKDNAACAADTGSATTPGTCNGNGNGVLDIAASAGATSEQVQFWKQLQLEGLVKGNFSGLTGGSGVYHNIPGVNSPAGKLSSSGWTAYFIINTVWGNVEWFTADHGNVLTFGKAVAGSINYGAALKPEEAWGIDTKIDDGKPGLGEVMSLWNAGCTLAGASTDTSFDYNLTNSTEVCRLEFPKAF